MNVAFSEGVQVAIISALGVIAVAVISSIPALLSRRASNLLSVKVGEPNGRGNVMDLLHRLDDGQRRVEESQARQDERHARTDERIAILEQARVQVAQSLGTLEGRVATLERHHID